MTSAKSTVKAYFLTRLKANRRITAVITVMHMLGAPLVLLYMLLDYLPKLTQYRAAEMLSETQCMAYPYFQEGYAAVAVIATIIGGLAGIIIAYSNFGYLFKKAEVDLYLSLPLSSRQRFLSDYFSGLVSYIAPFAVSCIVTTILNFIGQAIYPEQWARENVGEMLLYILVGGFFVMLMTYTLTVLVAVCCGTAFETIFYNVLLNVIIPIVIFAAGMAIFDNLNGIRGETAVLGLFQLTSPIGGLCAIPYVGGFIFGWAGAEGAAFVKWAVFYFLVTAAEFGAALLLYRRRKAEATSSPFAYKIFYYIALTAVEVMIYAALAVMAEAYLPCIILMAIVYLVFEVVTNRGFKKFWFSAVRFAATASAIALFFLLADVTGGFGAENRVPTSADVKSVKVSLYAGSGGGYADITFTDRENIDRIIAIHKSAVEKPSDENFFRSRYIDIDYNLSFGRSMSRSYSMYDVCLTVPLYTTDAYYKAVADSLLRELSRNVSRRGLELVYGDGSTSGYREINTEQAKAISAAYLNDMRAHYTDVLQGNEKVYGSLLYNYYIYDSYTETIAILKQIFGERPSDEEILSSTLRNSDAIYIYPTNAIEVSGMYVSGFGMRNWNIEERVIDMSSYPEALELFAKIYPYRQPQYISATPAYTINIAGEIYAVPSKYEATAKQLFEMSLSPEEYDLMKYGEEYYREKYGEDYAESEYYEDMPATAPALAE